MNFPVEHVFETAFRFTGGEHTLTLCSLHRFSVEHKFMYFEIYVKYLNFGATHLNFGEKDLSFSPLKTLSPRGIMIMWFDELP